MFGGSSLQRCQWQRTTQLHAGHCVWPILSSLQQHQGRLSTGVFGARLFIPPCSVVCCRLPWSCC